MQLEKMTLEDFESYLKIAIPNYAQEKMKAEGFEKEEAYELAQSTYKNLLSEGFNTKDHYLYVVKFNQKKVGLFWFAKKSNQNKEYAFIYDIMLDSEFRGQGLGKKLMNLIEEEIKKKNLSSVSLHVFEHNKVAVNLYKKSGYHTTNRIMVKDL